MICCHEKYEVAMEISGAELRRCRDCGLVVVSQKIRGFAPEIYQDYYQEDTGGRFGAGIECVVKAFRFVRALKIFLLKSDSRSILDIGSGRGWTLYFLKKYFHYETAVGTQISLPAYRFSREKLRLEIYNRDLLAIDFSRTFDVISLWHILEHVNQPEEYVEKISQLLSDNGRLLIEVPNFNAWSRRLVEKYWLGLDLKHHLTFFTPAALSALLLKYGFKIEKIRTFSLEYSTFTSTQSLVNFISGS
ncbi:MAG: class I SAM-dependent methyltransferase, partial [Candidatus Pacebacteria bacterium]|nr:class I SAM-dependent methyltransferase [Candidatus Paceibacterota bacterium]